MLTLKQNKCTAQDLTPLWHTKTSCFSLSSLLADDRRSWQQKSEHPVPAFQHWNCFPGASVVRLQHPGKHQVWGQHQRHLHGESRNCREAGSAARLRHVPPGGRHHVCSIQEHSAVGRQVTQKVAGLWIEPRLKGNTKKGKKSKLTEEPLLWAPNSPGAMTVFSSFQTCYGWFFFFLEIWN